MNVTAIKEHIKDVLQHNKQVNFSLLTVSLFFVVALAMPFFSILFEIKPTVANFDKIIISNASVNNLNIAKRVGLYNQLFLYILVASTLLFYVFKRFFSPKINSFSLIKTAQQTSVLGLLSVATSVLISNSEISVYWIVLLTTFLIIGAFHPNNTSIKAVLPVFVSLPFAVFIFSYIKNKNSFEFLNQPILIKGITVPLDLSSFVFVLLSFLFSLLLYIMFKFYKLENNVAYSVAIPIIASVPCITFVFEFFNILNKRFQIVFNSPFITFALLLILGIAGSLYLKKKEFTFKKSETLVVLIFVLAIALLVCIPYRVMYPPYEFFETANDGIAIEHFLNHGKIPFVENFDAHMFQNQFFSYLYVLFNGYEPFAPSLYILYFYVIEIVVLYIVLSKVLGKIPAIVLLLAMPSIGLILNEFALGGLMLLYVFKTIENPKFRNYIWFWVIAILLCLYKLDVGYAAVLSGIVLVLTFTKVVHKSFFIKDFVKSATYVAGPLLALFVILCLIKGINPIGRLQEFLLAAMSDQNWANTKMGDQSSFLFRVFYYILPIITTVIISLFFFVKVVFKSNFKLTFVLLGALFYYLFFVFNAQRGIVFHNFEYGNLIRISSTIFISLLFLLLYFDKKKQFVYFSFAFFSFFLILNSTAAVLTKEKHQSLLVRAVQSSSFHEKFLPLTPSNTRLKYTYSLAEIEYFKKFLDATLSEKETYYDFSSANMLYTLVNRISPSYVNQSPLMLNGEKAQILELQKIKDKDIKIVLMPIKNNYWHAISEVYVDFKYYKLAEYFYANFKPLYRNSLFDVYVRKDKFSVFSNKLNSLGVSNANFALTDFSLLNNESVIKNNLSLENNAGKWLVKGNGNQSYFIGLIETLRKNQSIKNENLPSKLVFQVNAIQAGSIKLYWKVNPTDSFTENNSKVFEIMPNTDQEIVLEQNKIPNELMVAVNIPELQLKEFKIIGDSKSSVKTPERIDYFIGFVPYLWGEKTEDILFNTIPEIKNFTEESTMSIPVKSINKNKSGTFLCMEFDSETDQTISVEIEKNQVIKATYGISLLPGKHKYKFKISNNYYWWNLTNFNINIKTQKAVKVTKLALLSEDLKNSEYYKTKGLTLSSLTDENWTLGVSKNLKMLLLDFSPTKENKIKNAKKIQFKDGIEVAIAGYNVSGNYIQVYVSEADIAKIKTTGNEALSIQIIN